MGEIRKLDALIGLLPELERSSYGEWSHAGGHTGTLGDPIPMSLVNYGAVADSLVDAIYGVVDSNPDLKLKWYSDILEDNGLEWSDESLSVADVYKLDETCVLAMLVAIVRAERFSEGILLRYLEEGRIQRWLRRLTD